MRTTHEATQANSIQTGSEALVPLKSRGRIAVEAVGSGLLMALAVAVPFGLGTGVVAGALSPESSCFQNAVKATAVVEGGTFVGGIGLSIVHNLGHIRIHRVRR